MALVASQTAGNRLSGSPSMRVRRKLTKVSTILMRLCVLLTSTKHLVRSPYDALLPSVAQSLLRSGMYLDGSKFRGFSSNGTVEDMASSAEVADCNDKVSFFCAPFGCGGICA